MDYKAIKELIDLINKSELALFEIKAEDIYIKMDKSYNRGLEKEIVFSKEEVATETIVEDKKLNLYSEPIVKTEEKVEVIEDNCKVVTSPMVGTFYGSPAPDKEFYVSVGSKVKKGDVLCIIEAMKLMNEIESEFDGEIVEILVENEAMVEYGQPLFKIRK